MATPIVVKGTELKLTFTVVEPSDTDLDAIEWILKYYTGSENDTGVVEISHKKSANTNEFISDNDILSIDKNTATLRIDTASMNPGTLKCFATLYLDDEAFKKETEDNDDGYRKEIQRITTNVKIIE